MFRVRNFRRFFYFLLAFSLLSFFAFSFFNSTLSVKLLIRDALYLTRPLWNTPGKSPDEIIPHYQSEAIHPSNMCKLHGWNKRGYASSEPVRYPIVIDAIIFSNELDLLEIRMKELWDVVDIFIVFEANYTFMGKPKPLFLKDNISRFKWAKKKLFHHQFSGLGPLSNGNNGFYNELVMRKEMTNMITRQAIKDDLIISSDLDEIPYKRTIELFKFCEGYASGIHLQMKNYIYSFEFYIDRANWKAHIHIFDVNNFNYFHNGIASKFLLADAGWHCSFCFRYLDEFIFKMKAYSHSDRVTNPNFLDKKVIQKKICAGEDLFEMYPEAFTFKELFSKLGPVTKTDSTHGISKYILENEKKFKYLLPGGCEREKGRVKNITSN